MSEPTDTRKRPAAPRSRGSSPPTQRRRQSEHALTTDRYASTTYPKVLLGRPDARQNSAPGSLVNSRARPAPYSADERHVDQHIRNSSRGASHGHERIQSGTGSAQPRGPNRDRVLSPMRNRSRSSTPVHVARTVPSMLPFAQKTVVKQTSPMDTLNALRSQKALRSINTGQATTSSNMAVVRALEAQLRAREIADEKMRAGFKQLEDKFKQLEDLPGQILALKRLNEEQQQVAAKHSVERRLGALETANESNENLARKIYGGTRPADNASDADESVIQRIVHLEDELRWLRKEQIALHDDQKALSEIVNKRPVAPGKPALPAPDLIQGKIETSIEALGTRLSNLDAAVKGVQVYHKNQNSITGQVRNFQSELSKLTTKCSTIFESQGSLQSGCGAMLERIKASEKKQCSLDNSYKKIAEEVKELKIEQETLAKQKKTISSEELGAELRHLADEQVKTSDRITKLEIASSSTTDLHQNGGKNDNNTTPGSPVMKEIQLRLRSLEDCVGETNSLSTVLQNLQKDVEEMDIELHDVKNDVAVISSSFKTVFAEQFDPFKASVEERLDVHSRDFDQYAETLSTMKEQIAKAQTEVPAPSFSPPQLLLIRNLVQESIKATPDLIRSQKSVQAEMEQCNAAVEDIKQQLLGKQDQESATQAIDTVKAAVRNLQNQYDNISTDDLHQKMVHWFVQHFPAAKTANMLQQFAVIQHEIANIRAFADLITRTPNGVQVLSGLVQIGPQITALVQSPQESKDSEGVLTKPSEAVETLRQSISTAHKQHETITKAVTGLQMTMQKLNSSSSPFVRTDSLAPLERSLSALRADVEAGFKRELDARTEFVTKASNEQKQRVNAESSIKSLIREKFEALENGKIKSLSDQLEELRFKLQAFSDLNDSDNKELLEYLPLLFVHTGQMQYVLEDVNQNLPQGRLGIEWSYDWKNEMHVKRPYHDEASEAADRVRKKR